MTSPPEPPKRGAPPTIDSIFATAVRGARPDLVQEAGPQVATVTCTGCGSPRVDKQRYGTCSFCGVPWFPPEDP